MNARFLSCLAFAALACGEPSPYESGLLKLGTGYNAKEVCSCLFVSERSEDECKAWTKVSPDIARFSVDMETKTVKSTAIGMAPSEFQFSSEEMGCIKVR